MVFQRDVQRLALGRQQGFRLPSLLRSDWLDLDERAGGGDPCAQITVPFDRATVQHCPVADRRIHRSGPRLDVSALGEHATDARHEHLQRRRLRDHVVAQVALRHDGVPRLRELYLVHAPDDPESNGVVAARPHWLHQASAYGTFDGLSFEFAYRVFDVTLQKWRVM